MAAPDAAPDDREMELWRQQQAAQAASNPILASMGPAAQVPGPTMPPGLSASTPMPEPAAPAPVEAPSAHPATSSRPILDTKSTSQTSEKLSEVQQEDFAQLDKIRTDEQAATKQLTADKVKDAGLEQKAADDMAQAQLEAQAQKAAAIQQAQERRAQAEGAYQQKLEAFNGKEFHSFWSGRPAAAEILADIGVALGAFGASGRGQNEALQILNGRVQQDFDVQKAQIEKAKDSVLMAKTGIADADQARQVAMEDLDIKRNAAMEAIKARLVAGKSAQLGDRAKAEGDMDVAKIAKDIQERKERTTAGMATRTTSTSNYINPAAIEAKAGARKEASAKEDRAQVFDKNGKYLGDVTSGRGGAQAFATRDAQYDEAINKAKALLARFPEGGTTITDTGAKGDIANAIAAAVTVTSLPKNEEAQHLEARSMGITEGPLGTSYVNPEVLRGRIKQMEETRNNYRTQGLVQVANGKTNESRTSIPKETASQPERQTPPHLDSALVTQAREILADSQAPKAVKDRARELLLAARVGGN